MNDRYLWDHSGMPDPEVQDLERIFGALRYEDREFVLPAPRRSTGLKVAAVAAILIITSVVAFWASLIQLHSTDMNPPPVPPLEAANSGAPAALPAEHDSPVVAKREVAASPSGSSAGVALRHRPRHAVAKAVSPQDLLADTAPAAVVRGEAHRGKHWEESIAEHIERAQLLLRSIRNSRPLLDGQPIDVAYENRLAKGLLSQNVAMRRTAEDRGDLYREELLARLEAFLLDIANLGAAASSEEVRSINERMERSEIIADLQVHLIAARNLSARGGQVEAGDDVPY
ncbi:MAG: hypothetical protein ACLGJB_04950 [Blastocatellia bacterium]